MTERSRLEEEEKTSETSWSTSEREFLRHDVYEFGPEAGGAFRDTVFTSTVFAGEDRDVVAQVRIRPGEVRLLDGRGTEIVTVRGRKKTRAVEFRQRPIGAIRVRRANWLRRPTWLLEDRRGEVVASVSERALSTIGRRAWKVLAEFGGGTYAPPERLVIRAGDREVGRIAWGDLDFSAETLTTLDRKLVLAAWLALSLDRFGLDR